MTLQLATDIQNARLDVIESTTGTSPILVVFTGSQPANCAAASTGSTLATMTLPVDWMALAAAGSKGLSGTWQDLVADASGTPGHFRIFESTGVTCKIQGSASVNGGGGLMQFDTVPFVVGGVVAVTAFTLIDGNG